MNIKTLEEMETIVSNNESLSWDGWNVVELTKSAKAIFSKSGAYVDGSWYTKRVFILDQDGWRIPHKYVR